MFGYLRKAFRMIWSAAARRVFNLDLEPPEDFLATIYHALGLAPEMEILEFNWENGRCEVVLPEVEGHAMVVFE